MNAQAQGGPNGPPLAPTAQQLAEHYADFDPNEGPNTTVRLASFEVPPATHIIDSLQRADNTVDIGRRALQSVAKLAADGFGGNAVNAARSMRQELAPVVTNIPCRESPFTVKNKAWVTQLWMIYLLNHTACQISLEEAWYLPTIVKYAVSFPGFCVWFCRPKQGGEIRARTLETYVRLFLGLVQTKCVDPGPPEERAGFKALHTHGIFKLVMDAAHWTVNCRGLIRHPKEKAYYGREELALIIRHVLEGATTLSKLLVALSSISRLLFTFYGTFRPSSLGWPTTKAKDLGMFPVVGDLTIIKTGFGEWDLVFNCKNFKGSFDTMTALAKKYRFDHVQFAQNVYFDTAMYVVLSLYLRGLLRTEYKTLFDLFSDPAPIVRIKQDRLGEPLFPAANEGANGFVEPIEPCSAQAISGFTRNACEQVNLPVHGPTVFRRDAGNAYALLVSKETAQNLMNHTALNTKVIDQNYLEGPASLNLTAIRLQEVGSDMKTLVQKFRKYVGRSVELAAWVNVHMIKSKLQGGERGLQQKDDQLAQERKKAATAAAEDTVGILAEKWQHFLAHFEATWTIPGRHQLVQKPGKAKGAEYIRLASSGPEYQLKTYSIRFRDDVEEHKLAAQEELAAMAPYWGVASTKRRKAAREVKGVQTRKAKKKATNNEDVVGTAKERREIIEYTLGNVDESITAALQSGSAQQAFKEFIERSRYGEDIEDMPHFAPLDAPKPSRSRRRGEADSTDEPENSVELILQRISATNRSIEVQLEADEAEIAAIDAMENDLVQEEKSTVMFTETAVLQGSKRLFGRKLADADRDEKEDFDYVPDPVYYAEEYEMDPLKLDIRLVKFMVASQLMKPVQEAEELSKCEMSPTDKESRGLESDKAHFWCLACEDQGMERSFKGAHALYKHRLQSHTEWGELSTRCVAAGRCEECKTKTRTAKAFRIHVTLNKQRCPKAKDYRDLYDAHSLLTAKFHQVKESSSEDDDAEADEASSDGGEDPEEPIDPLSSWEALVQSAHKVHGDFYKCPSCNIKFLDLNTLEVHVNNSMAFCPGRAAYQALWAKRVQNPGKRRTPPTKRQQGSKRKTKKARVSEPGTVVGPSTGAAMAASVTNRETIEEDEEVVLELLGLLTVSVDD